MYELREKCGRDARDWFKHFHEDDQDPSGVSLLTQNEYSNHYNKELNRCYALLLQTRFLTEGKQKDCHLNTISVVDVNENRTVGDYFKNCESPTPVRCNVEGQSCTSQEQFERLTVPYLTK